MNRRASRSRSAVKRVAKLPRSEKSRSERLFRTLLSGCRKPADLIELYYWSREPGMLKVMRSIVGLPDESKAALETFMALARDPKKVAAWWDANGTLTLASEEVTRTFALAEHVGEAEEPPRVLN